MRALVLGGAGAVCSETTRDLAEYSDYKEIVVADANFDAVNHLIDSIGDSRLKPLHFDAEDTNAMLKLFPDFDVVVNGLPWKYDLAVTKACAQVGVNGLDVSTEEEQWDYDSAAKEKGIVFIPGVGATPGITNAMARYAYDRLDSVEDIQINFAAFRCPAPAPGLLITFLYEFKPENEERVYYKDGEFIKVGPFEGIKSIDFPGPIGEQEVCYIPHSETWTMPQSLGASSVAVRGCFPPHAMRLAKTLLESGFYSEEPITFKGIETTPYEMMFESLIRMEESKKTPLWAYGLVVEVKGKQNGGDVRFRLWNQHPPMEEWGGKAAYYKNIAIPLSIGAQMITRGDVNAKGVVPPETALNPEILFSELKKRGIEIEVARQES